MFFFYEYKDYMLMVFMVFFKKCILIIIFIYVYVSIVKLFGLKIEFCFSY